MFSVLYELWSAVHQLFWINFLVSAYLFVRCSNHTCVWCLCEDACTYVLNSWNLDWNRLVCSWLIWVQAPLIPEKEKKITFVSDTFSHGRRQPRWTSLHLIGTCSKQIWMCGKATTVTMGAKIVGMPRIPTPIWSFHDHCHHPTCQHLHRPGFHHCELVAFRGWIIRTDPNMWFTFLWWPDLELADTPLHPPLPGHPLQLDQPAIHHQRQPCQTWLESLTESLSYRYSAASVPVVSLVGSVSSCVYLDVSACSVSTRFFLVHFMS